MSLRKPVDDFDDETPTLEDDFDIPGLGGGEPELEAAAPVAQPNQPQQQRQMQPADFKHFASIYPVYFDAALTVAQGRRLPKDKLVGCACMRGAPPPPRRRRRGKRSMTRAPAHAPTHPYLQVRT